MKAKKAALLIINSKESGLVSKEYTDWVNKLYCPAMLKNGLKAQALMIPTNIFGKISVTNMQNQLHTSLNVHYFDDALKAKEWIVQLQ